MSILFDSSTSRIARITYYVGLRGEGGGRIRGVFFVRESDI